MRKTHAREYDPRTRYYKLLRVGQRKLGMSDDDYRAFLASCGAKKKDGKISATTLQFGDLVAAVEKMKKAGFKPVAKKSATHRATDDRKPLIGKITKLWFLLFEAGVVRNKSEASMVKWCASITHTAKLEWASERDLHRCIEALKKWCDRERVAYKESP